MGRRSNTRVPSGVAAVVLTALGSTVAGSCAAIGDVAPDDHCDEAGYSIANRTLTCTGDPELANARYRQFDKQYVCLPAVQASAGEEAYACAVELRALSCEQAETAGDSIDAWILQTGSCAAVITRADGDAPMNPCEDNETQCLSSCVDLATHAFNCGECGIECPADTQHPVNKIGVCIDGECGVACKGTALDCDSDPGTCETALDGLENCGGCGQVCDAGVNGFNPVCVSGSCYFDCLSGFGDCDENRVNGCEADLTTPAACGQCGVACDAETESPFNQEAVCVGGRCEIGCQAPFADCGGSTETCETDTSTDLNHCGGCNQPCAGTCAAGVCS